MNVCPICGESTNLVINALLGYQQGQTYDIYFCKNCDASYANPLEIDEDTYNSIYSQANILPGYDRYYRHAQDVLKVKNPLKYLATTENTYWAIYKFLNEDQGQSNPRILEVGCGLGYLTYSLHKSGYNITGIDISDKAIEEAKRKYGDYYEQADVYEYCLRNDSKYDIIILTEVIEHIPHPLEFVESLKKLLVIKGSILITTPNKISIEKNNYWDTELPPVHLWWFSKKSFQNIGTSLGMVVSFIDFKIFQNSQIQAHQHNGPWRQQTLDTGGKALFKISHNVTRHVLRRIMIDVGLWQPIKRVLSVITNRDRNIESDRICAVLTKEQ